MKTKRKQMLFLAMFATIALANVVFVGAAYTSVAVSGTTTPSSISPDENGNLILTISNDGTDYARSTKLTISSHSYITFDDQSFDLQTIGPGSSKQVSVPITVSSDLADSATTVFITVKYSDGGSITTSTLSTSVSLSISQRSLVQIEEVEWSSALIEPGDVINATVHLKNVGSGELTDVVMEFGNSSMPFVSAESDLEVYLGDLSPNEEEMAAFSIILNKDATTTAYSVPITISYYDASGAMHEDTKNIGMKVSGQPDFVVTMEDDTGMLAGRAGELTISIANRGTATANFLTLSFDSNLDVTPKDYYVGNLDPDDYETITLSVDLSSISAGKRDLSVSMDYKDPYNQDMEETATVEFTARIVPLKLPTTVKYIIYAVIIAVVYYKRSFVMKLLGRKPKN